MKALKVFEKFTEDESDPIRDLGIGKKGLIKMWLSERNIGNYIILDDDTVDTNQTVVIRNLNGNLPDFIQFNEIKNGSFICRNNNMTSLKGCPINVEHRFDCSYNNLISLEYAPRYCESFECHHNIEDFRPSDVLSKSLVRNSIIWDETRATWSRKEQGYN